MSSAGLRVLSVEAERGGAEDRVHGEQGRVCGRPGQPMWVRLPLADTQSIRNDYVGLRAELGEGDVRKRGSWHQTSCRYGDAAVQFLIQTLNARDLQEWCPGSHTEEMHKPEFRLLCLSGSRHTRGGQAKQPAEINGFFFFFFFEPSLVPVLLGLSEPVMLLIDHICKGDEPVCSGGLGYQSQKPCLQQLKRLEYLLL